MIIYCLTFLNYCLMMIKNIAQINYKFLYLLATICSFIIVVHPLFHYNGLLIDYDYKDFVVLDFSGLILEFQEHGMYRVFNLIVAFSLAKVFDFLPFQSYAVLLIFYITYLILFEKIFKLLRFSLQIRLTCYFLSTSTILALPTIFLWSRAMNELLSVLLAWFFISKIVSTKNEWTSILIVIVWGLFAIMTYELHFPFFVGLLLALGFLGIKSVLISSFCLPFLYFLLPIKIGKIDLSFGSFVSNIDNLFFYINLKVTELLFTLSFFRLEDLYISVIIIVISLYTFSYRRENIESVIKNRTCFLIIVLNTFVIFIFYVLSKSNNPETIPTYGKLSWNVVNAYWIFSIAAIISVAKNKVALLSISIPVFCITSLSAVLVRILSREIRLNDQVKPSSLVENINYSVFKNIFFFL